MQLRLTLADRFGRVGCGPFPSEAIDEWGEKLQTIGREVNKISSFGCLGNCEYVERGNRSPKTYPTPVIYRIRY